MTCTKHSWCRRKAGRAPRVDRGLAREFYPAISLLERFPGDPLWRWVRLGCPRAHIKLIKTLTEASPRASYRCSICEAQRRLIRGARTP